MKKVLESRRQFLKTAGMTAGAMLLPSRESSIQAGTAMQDDAVSGASADSRTADYTLRIKTAPVEIAKNRILSLTTYNGQFPRPLLRFKEGQQAIVDVYYESAFPRAIALARADGAG